MKLGKLCRQILGLSAVALSLSAGSCDGDCNDSASMAQSADVGSAAAYVKFQDAQSAALQAGRRDCVEIGQPYLNNAFEDAAYKGAF